MYEHCFSSRLTTHYEQAVPSSQTAFGALAQNAPVAILCLIARATFFIECLSKSIAFSPRLTTRGECAARTMEYKKSPITSKLASDSLLYSTLLLLKHSSVRQLLLRSPRFSFPFLRQLRNERILKQQGSYLQTQDILQRSVCHLLL